MIYNVMLISGNCTFVTLSTVDHCGWSVVFPWNDYVSVSSTHLNAVLLPFAAEALFIQLSDPFPREYSSIGTIPHVVADLLYPWKKASSGYSCTAIFSVLRGGVPYFSSKQSSSILSSYLLCIHMIASHLILHL